MALRGSAARREGRPLTSPKRTLAGHSRGVFMSSRPSLVRINLAKFGSNGRHVLNQMQSRMLELAGVLVDQISAASRPAVQRSFQLLTGLQLAPGPSSRRQGLSLTWDSAGAPPRRQRANDEYHTGAGTEHVTPSTASQHQQAADDHYHAGAGTEHPTPSTHGSTPSSVAVLAIL
jgi:hypothetical protein